jgi:EpsI family protein
MSATLAARVSPAAVTGITLIAALALAAFAYASTLAGLWRIWVDPDEATYSHGLLLVAVALGLSAQRLWRARAVLVPRPSLLGLAGVGLLCMGWFLGGVLSIQAAQQLAVAASLPLILWAILGRRGLLALGPAPWLLLFAVPVWSVLNEILRGFTADTVGVVMNGVGITTVVDGSSLLVPAGTFEVADNCTGLRQLVVAMPLALIFAQVLGLRAWAGALVFGAAVLLSVALNTLRILIVVYAGAVTEMQHYFVTEDHVGLGWVLFAVGMTAFLFALARWAPQAWYADAPSDAGDAVGDLRGAAVGLVMIGLVVILTAAPLLERWYGRDAAASELMSVRLPATSDAWARLAGVSSLGPGGDERWGMGAIGAQAMAAGAYRDRSGRLLDAYVACYAEQGQGREAVSGQHRLYDTQHWRTEQRRALAVPTPPGVVEERVLVDSAGERRIVWHWYVLGNRQTGSAYRAKLLGLLELLRGNRAASLVAVAGDVVDSPEGTRAALTRYIEMQGAALGAACLPVQP